MNTDNKSEPEGLVCPVCGQLSQTLEEYAEHKLTHDE